MFSRPAGDCQPHGAAERWGRPAGETGKQQLPPGKHAGQARWLQEASPQQGLGPDPARQPPSLPSVSSGGEGSEGLSAGMEQPGLKVKTSPAAPFAHLCPSSGRV